MQINITTHDMAEVHGVIQQVDDVLSTLTLSDRRVYDCVVDQHHVLKKLETKWLNQLDSQSTLL